MIKFFNLMKEHEEDLARLMTLENGKTLTEAKTRLTEPNLESGANIDCCKLYRDNKAVRPYAIPLHLHLNLLQEYERIVRESIRRQLGL